MNLSNLEPVTGSPRKADSIIGATVVTAEGKKVKNPKVAKPLADINYNGNRTFRLHKRFVKQIESLGNYGLTVATQKGVKLSEVNEFAFILQDKSVATYLSNSARQGVNRATGQKVDGKPSTLISNGILEAYLINTGKITKDVKAAFTLSKVEQNGNIYFVFDTPVAESTQEVTNESNNEVTDEVIFEEKVTENTSNEADDEI